MARVAFLTHKLSRYDAISTYTFSIIKELAKSFHISLFSFAVDEHFLKDSSTQKVIVDFLTNRHEHVFSEEIKAMIYPKKIVEKLLAHDLLLISTESARECRFKNS